jgi:hypothetical protein
MKRSQRGIWLVVAIFMVGAAALAGLFLSPRPRASSTRPVDSVAR